ncbi:MAG: hypothetical protein HFI90_05830 [Clostridia bacterium]|nr:hypothetical protein [Clostridia bacterium]
MKKRILALFVAVLLAGTLVNVGATEENAQTEPSYQVAFLTKLGILPNDFNADATYTKAEFVCLVMKALGGAENFGTGDKVYFLDVTQERADYAAIYAAAALGIVRGEENYLFNPDKTISYEEAVSIAVNAMGYNVKAMVNGGYPAGYIMVARDVGILVNVGNEAKSGNLANLIFNMMKEPMLATSTVSNEYVTYQGDDEDYTILHVYWNIKLGKGMVTETAETSLSGAGRMGKGNVRIGDNVFSQEDTNAANYFGYQVEFFYKDENETVNPLVYVYTKSKMNTEKQIAAADIRSVDMLSRTISYYDGARTGKESFAAAVYVVYNGVVLTDYTEEDLMPDYGNITLLDNNNDGVYEFIFVNEIHYFVVGSANESAMKIYEKYTGETLDLSGQSVSVRITKDGAEFSLSKLAAYHVLSVKASRDATKYDITVSDKVVKGKVESIDSEGDITINGSVYEVYKNIENRPKLGDTGAFYISAEGLLVAAERTHVQRVAVVCELGTAAALDNGYQMKVVTANGEAVWNLANKVKLNDTTVTAMNAFNTLRELYSDKSNSRIIDYELNNSGELQTINTPQNNTDGSIKYDESVLTMDFETTAGHRYFNQLLGAKYKLNSDCTVVYTSMIDAEGKMDPDYVAIGTVGALESGDSYNNFRLYSIDEYQCASIMELTNRTSKGSAMDFSYDAQAFIVAKIARETDKEGMQATKIYGYQGGSYTSALFNGESTVDDQYPNTVSTPIQSPADLKVGDMLQLTRDDNGIVTTYRVLYNIVDGLEEKEIMQHLGSGYQGYPHIDTAMGTVERYSDDVMLVKVGSVTNLYLTNNPKVYKYKDGEIEEAVLGDVEASALTGHGSKVLVHANQKKIQELIIFE